MDVAMRAILIKGRVLLLDNLDMTFIVDHLVQEEIISLDHREDIMTERTRRQKVERFLVLVETLPQRERVFEYLCKAMKAEGYDFLVDELKQIVENDETDLKSVENHGVKYVKKETDICIDEIPLPVSYFYERKSVLPKLQQHLKDKHFLILSGIRGSGKTQLARHLAHQLVNLSECSGVKVEMYCRSSGSMMRGLEFLANTLNIRSKANATGFTDTLKQHLTQILEHLECNARLNGNSHVIVLDDISAETIQHLPMQYLKSLSGNVKIITTTNNSTLLPMLNINIDGFTTEETLAFFRQDFPQCSEQDSSILELGEKFSFLPLGIAVAKQFIRKRHQSIEKYILQLMSNATTLKLQAREATLFNEGEYDRGLISALQMSIDEVRLGVSEQAFRAYELTSYLSHMRVPLDHLKLQLIGSEEEKDMEIDDLIESITHTSIGSINTINTDKNKQQRMLNTHRAVLLVLQLGWSKEKAQNVLEDCLVFLSQLTNKDTRFESAFILQLTLLPHAERALSHTHDFAACNLTIKFAEIRLLEALGHMYSQITMLEKSEQYVLRARERFVEYFLPEMMPSKLEASQSNSKCISSLAKSIINILKDECEKYSADDIVNLILMRIHSQQDVKLWSCKYKQKVNRKRSSLKIRNQQLVKSQYDEMVKAGVALPPDTIHKILMPELIITILYTYGRIYCFRKSKGENVSQEREDRFVFALKLSQELCKVVKEEYDVSLLHLVLTQHYGLLYHLMDEHNKTREDIIRDISKAITCYEEAYHDQESYFQNGLLKKDGMEVFNTAVGLRQQLKCYCKLIKYTHDEQEKHQLILKGKEVNMLLAVASEDQDGCVLILNKASFYNQRADFYLLLYQLNEHDNCSELENAIHYYTESICLEQSSGLIRYPWLLALMGLTEACLLRGQDADISLASHKVGHFLKQLSGRECVFEHEWKVASALMGRLSPTQSINRN